MKFILMGLLAMQISAAPLWGHASENLQTRRMLASDEVTKVFTDSVKKVREDDEGLVILFSKNPGSYYLQRSHELFEKNKDLLMKSHKEKKPVSVTADVEDLNILEVK